MPSSRFIFTATVTACLTTRIVAADVVPPSNAITAAEIRQGYRNGHVVYALKPNITPLFTSKYLKQAPHLPASGTAEVRALKKGISVAEAIAGLRNDPAVAYVEPDYLVKLRVPMPPKTNSSTTSTDTKHSRNAGNLSPVEIKCNHDSKRVIVAIIDTGIRITHCELRENLWANPIECTDANRSDHKDNDHNCYVDDVHGIDATVPPEDPNSGQPQRAENRYHGTAVASIIGASGRGGTNVSGVAQNVLLMGLRAFPDLVNNGSEELASFASLTSIVACIRYAVANGAKVINASYGQRFFSQSEFDALKEARTAGVIVVAATENGRRNNDTEPEYPASYPLDNIVAVTGCGNDGTLRDNYGSGRVDLAALSVGIRSCGVESDASVSEGNEGTSFAAPQVTGALALLTEKFPDENYRTRINRLLRGTKHPSGQDYLGRLSANGVLDVQGALATDNGRPINDDLCHATALAGEFVVARGSNLGATLEPHENHETEAALKATIWWAWKAPNKGRYLISTVGSEADATAVLYLVNQKGELSRLTPKEQKSSASAYDIELGREYRIAVGSSSKVGGVQLSLGQRPKNDSVREPDPIQGINQTIYGQNRLATRDTLDIFQGRSVWYRWTSQKAAHCMVVLASDEFAAAFTVYAGDENGPIRVLKSAKCDGRINAEASFKAAKNKTYYIAIDSQDRGTGNFRFDLNAY